MRSELTKLDVHLYTKMEAIAIHTLNIDLLKPTGYVMHQQV